MDEINKLHNKIVDALSNNTSNDDISEIIKEANDLTFSVESNPYRIQLRYKNESNNPDLDYGKISNSGFDLHANITEPITLKPLERFAVPTGLYFEIPIGYEIQVRPRSGLAAKHGITVLNSPGTVDCGYRGQVKVILVNLSNDEYTIDHGDRIAQGVFTTVAGAILTDLVRVDEISEDTDRGSNGFGSSGY